MLIYLQMQKKKRPSKAKSSGCTHLNIENQSSKLHITVYKVYVPSSSLRYSFP